jgi:GNAT superfamily N-acetyltransferase
MVRILKITADKKRFLPLLLLGDEQESMIDRYLEDGEMFALYDGGLRTIAVVEKQPKRVYELKNLATEPSYQRRGYGKRMVEYLLTYYHGRGRMMQVGTGAGSSNVSFYEKCGFSVCRTVEGFFTENYENPIYEDGRQIKDMVYLQREL